MNPVAVMLTSLNCNQYVVEINWAVNHIVARHTPSTWIGYYLVVTEDGPEVLKARKFHENWKFIQHNHNPNELSRIESHV